MGSQFNEAGTQFDEKPVVHFHSKGRLVLPSSVAEFDGYAQNLTKQLCTLVA